MTVQEEDVATFTALGLTRTQAKVYLTCIRLGNAKASLIWKLTGVSRQDIYRVLSELQKIGLVEKLLGEPAKFQAVDLKKGFSILLKRKADEYKEVSEKANKMLSRITEIKKNDNEYQFILTEQQDTSLRKIEELLERIHKSVDVIEYWGSLKNTFSRFSDFCRKQLEEGVKFRFIIEKPENTAELLKVFGSVINHESFKVKLSSKPLAAAFGIYDEEDLVFLTQKFLEGKAPPYFFTNNKCFINLFKEYYEFKWKESEEINKAQVQKP